ncbi:MAG: metal transporter [Alphaproteobacteria bacterium]|nr:metal transporter [Alphaproteobacteria bacterium]
MTGDSAATRALWVALPTALIALVAWAFVTLDPLANLGGGVPPVEELTVERTVLDDNGIKLLIRAGGTEPMVLAQVQVDGAYWRFHQEPEGSLARLNQAWIDIPYPWVLGETHHITLITGTGVTFEHTIDVAVATPRPDRDMLVTYALVGVFVGVVPVVLGMLFFPALRSASVNTMTFTLALTVGLLAFLLVDTMAEALELAEAAAAPFSIVELVWLVAAATAAALFAIGQRTGAPYAPITLAVSIAVGIGLHNFGEGLAIGSAFATGAAALGSYLVIGFTLHNITEGVGIVAPLTKQRPSIVLLGGLALLAGLPAVFGIWLGAFAFSPHWAALALAVGAGAILQVIVQVSWLIQRQAQMAGASSAVASLSGGALGLVLMYGTSLLVQA